MSAYSSCNTSSSSSDSLFANLLVSMTQQSLSEPQPEDWALNDVPYQHINRGIGLDDGQNSYGNKRDCEDMASVLSILGEVLDLLDESFEDELFSLPADDAPENDDDSVVQ
jgi:hypothetical protein